MGDNIIDMQQQRAKAAKKRVKNLLKLFKPKTTAQKHNDLIQKRLEMQQKSDENL